MSRSAELGIQRLEGVHFYAHDIDRHRQFWVDRLDFAFIGESDDASVARHGQKTEVYEAGKARYYYTRPETGSSLAGRYLARHPDGVAELIFTVDDVESALAVLEKRGAAIIDDIETVTDGAGTWKSFTFATAFGDTVFRFVQRENWDGIFPGIARFDAPRGGSNAFGFGEIDHVTSNFFTLKPFVLWCKEVLGLEEYWGIEFHTRDYATQEAHTGSGLRSTVLWDPHSGVKFANNEPLRPWFRRSQVYTFVEDNAGPGVQHTALTIADIVGTVEAMRERGIEFMPTPGTYYDALPARLQEAGIEIDEPMDELRRTQILVDGEGPGRYMLQIFARDFAGLFGDPKGGPFFLEIIQRKGDRGFGGGNFRALFESIERAQVAEGKI